MENVDIGKVNYEAYCIAVGGVSHNGDKLPTWYEMLRDNPKIANAWRYAANVLLQEF